MGTNVTIQTRETIQDYKAPYWTIGSYLGPYRNIRDHYHTGP